jgi:hypothetical protein
LLALHEQVGSRHRRLIPLGDDGRGYDRTRPDQFRDDVKYGNQPGSLLAHSFTQRPSGVQMKPSITVPVGYAFPSL